MFIRRLVVSIPTRNGRERLQLSHYLYTSIRKVIGAQGDGPSRLFPRSLTAVSCHLFVR